MKQLARSHWLAFNRPHTTTSQNMELFTNTVVNTSEPTTTILMIIMVSNDCFSFSIMNVFRIFCLGNHIICFPCFQYINEFMNKINYTKTVSVFMLFIFKQ
jgi:hypothetical protein